MSANPPAELSMKELGEKQKLFDLFFFGFDHWLVQKSPEEVLERIKAIGTNPLGRAQLNQLPHLCHEPGISDGFFHYYWLSRLKLHPYEVDKIPGFSPDILIGDLLQSQEHLKWGLYRLYVDALLFFGDVRIAFNKVPTLSARQLEELFESKRLSSDGQRLGSSRFTSPCFRRA